MTEAEFREMVVSVARIEERVEALGDRVEALEHVPRGGSNGPNGRRLRDRALPLGRDGLVLALIAEVVYRMVS